MPRSRAPGAWSAVARLFALAGPLLVAAAPAGAADVWLGAGAGQVSPEGVNDTVCIAGEVRLGLGRHFALQPDLGWWKRTETTSGVSVSASDFSFGATALVLLPVRPVTFFAGGGPSVHYLSGDVGYYGFKVTSDSVTRVGIGVLGGLDVAISRSVAFFVAARYDWVSLETESPDSVNQRRVYGGFRLRL